MDYSQEAGLSRYLYNGKYGVSTDENGLYYMRQRYYNTEIKRFINQDIVVGSIGNSQSLNRYSYVQGNPVTLTDPFGLSPSAKDIIMGAIHGLLDVVGCSPEGIGIAANLLNAALYAFVDHDYGMASLSLLAGATLGATKVVAMGGKLAKAAKTVATAGKFISNVASFAICATQAADVGSAMWQKYYVEGKSLDSGSAMEFLALGLNMAGMAMSGKGMVESGNKICKSIKESGVTNKISGKVKAGAKSAWNNNSGKVDLDAPVGISNQTKQIAGTSYDINKLTKTQSRVDNSKVASMKEKIAKEGIDIVPPISVRVHKGEALVVQGHHRLEAFRQLGYDRVPIKYVHKSQLGKLQKDGDYFRTLEELLAGRINN